MKKTKVILTLVCAVLLVAASVMGTLAYLTATTGEVVNTFIVGNVGFDPNGALDEAPVDEEGQAKDGDRVTANSYKLMPGHSYDKDPQVHIAATSEDAWLFVKVVNPIAVIEDQTDAGKTIAAQMTEIGWTLVDGETNIYAYKETVSASDDIYVFKTFKLADDADTEGYEGVQITIQAGLIQADGFDTAAAAWTAAGNALFTVADDAE